MQSEYPDIQVGFLSFYTLTEGDLNTEDLQDEGVMCYKVIVVFLAGPPSNPMHALHSSWREALSLDEALAWSL